MQLALFAAYETTRLSQKVAADLAAEFARRLGRKPGFYYDTLKHILLRAGLYSSAKGSGCCSMHLSQKEDESSAAFIKKKQSQRGVHSR
jgi:hypothetical protein